MLLSSSIDALQGSEFHWTLVQMLILTYAVHFRETNWTERLRNQKGKVQEKIVSSFASYKLWTVAERMTPAAVQQYLGNVEHPTPMAGVNNYFNPKTW